jgi:tRNA A-37 threonylcarbamoyl transferase component Bud32
MEVDAQGTRDARAEPPGPARLAAAFQGALQGAIRPSRRRRPTGEAAPLPHHIQLSGIGWLAVWAVLTVTSMLVFGRGLRGPAVTATVLDDRVVSAVQDLAPAGFWQALAVLCSWWVLNVVYIAMQVTLLVMRRFRQLILTVVMANIVTAVTQDLLGGIARRPRPFGVPIAIGWGGWALPSTQMAALSFGLLVALYTLVPEGRWRNRGKVIAAVLIVLAALGRIGTGADAVTDVLTGVATGVAFPLIAFRFFLPSALYPISYRKRGRSAHLDVTGARGEAIHRALSDQLGLQVAEIKPFGLSGSAGSTPLRIRLATDDPEAPPQYLFGKLYARSHLRADRWYKLGRELLYGRLEDEKPFNSVRRLVQQEDYALRVMRDAGLPTAAPGGFVELTPEREYLLVTQFFEGATELGDADLSDPAVADQVIDDGLAIVRKMWDAGLAHRDVKPANLLVRDGHMLMIDVAFVEARPSPWRQAVDLANMMLCLALRTSPERVYERALRSFTIEEITEGFAAARGLALPSQLRHIMRAQGRDLHAEFVRLLPRPPQPIRIQRWSAYRVGLWALSLLALLFVLTSMLGMLNNDIAVRTSIGSGSLDCDDPQPLWLEAQAVPGAAYVPCLRTLATGWMLEDAAVNSGQVVFSLGHDRAGANLLSGRFDRGCDTAGARPLPDPAPGVSRSVREPAVAGQPTIWFDRFQGGCVTWELRSIGLAGGSPTGGFGVEVTRMIGLADRAGLAAELDRRSDGRLHLDP